LRPKYREVLNTKAPSHRETRRRKESMRAVRRGMAIALVFLNPSSVPLRLGVESAAFPCLCVEPAAR
jgi:hypothetical protein